MRLSAHQCRGLCRLHVWPSRVPSEASLSHGIRATNGDPTDREIVRAIVGSARTFVKHTAFARCCGFPALLDGVAADASNANDHQADAMSLVMGATVGLAPMPVWLRSDRALSHNCRAAG